MSRQEGSTSSGRFGVPDPLWSAARAFVATASSVTEARRWVRSELQVRSLPSDVLDVAELLVSEVATNAVKHADGHRIEVQLSLNSHLHIAIHDGSELLPRVMHPRIVDTGGRGLILVRALASSWGTRRDMSGKWVWFRVALP
jgi:anti-sigma regulatory factor (Ser/Thr protein kinase)